MENKNQPRPHAKLIHAWANGAEIEFYDPNTKSWVLVNHPVWNADKQYRIKTKTFRGAIAEVTMPDYKWALIRVEEARMKHVASQSYFIRYITDIIDIQE